MEIFYILGGILLAVVAVVAWLFYSLKKTRRDREEVKVVALNDLSVLDRSDPEGIRDGIEPLSVAVDQDKQIVTLQEEIRLAREKTLMLTRDFNDSIAKMRMENESLRADINDLQQINRRLNEEELSHLKAENAAYKAQMETGNAEALEDLKGSFTTKIESLNTELDQLKSVSPEAFEALKEDVEVLRVDRARFEARVEDLEDLLRGESEKNSFLQYELTKSRAHALGVERICDNARRQFEGMSREVHDSELDNEALKKQSGLLEQSLSDFRRLNAELLKKEKLTQFEIESNRSQLKDLEHIYGVFRSRLQNAGAGDLQLITNS